MTEYKKACRHCDSMMSKSRKDVCAHEWKTQTSKETYPFSYDALRVTRTCIHCDEVQELVTDDTSQPSPILRRAWRVIQRGKMRDEHTGGNACTNVEIERICAKCDEVYKLVTNAVEAVEGSRSAVEEMVGKLKEKRCDNYHSNSALSALQGTYSELVKKYEAEVRDHQIDVSQLNTIISAKDAFLEEEIKYANKYKETLRILTQRRMGKKRKALIDELVTLKKRCQSLESNRDFWRSLIRDQQTKTKLCYEEE